MHPYNHKLNNIELYSLSGIDLVDLINDYKGKGLHVSDKGWLNLSSRGGRDGNVVDNIGKRLFVDFDTKAGGSDSNRSTVADLYLSTSYNSQEVGFVVEQIESGYQLDGRWLLAAQHLEAWARFFSPEAAHLLPGLGLTMTRLLAMESALRAD